MGILFFALLFIGAATGLLTYKYILERPFFDSGPHAYFGMAILILFSLGVGMGYRLSNGTGTDNLPKMHMMVNLSGAILILFQILLGISLLIEVIGY